MEGIITIALVVITSLISIQGFSRPGIVERLKHSPYREKHAREWYRLVTSGFVHGGWFHLIINMFVFYEFGRLIEAHFIQFFGNAGGFIYLLMYVLSIAAGDLPSLVKHRDNPHYASIGASGAVSAIVFIYILIYPWRMLYLYGILPIPAIVGGIAYLWYSSWASKNQQSRIDHMAHFYGAVFGVIFVICLRPILAVEFAHKADRHPIFLTSARKTGLFFRHKRVTVITRRNKVLLHRPCRDPAVEVQD